MPLVSQWETHLSALAKSSAAQAHVAETRLQKVICTHLKGFEACALKQKAFYQRVLDSSDTHGTQYADVISLNFDRTLAMSQPSSKLVTMRATKVTAALQRHFQIPPQAGEGDVSARIWHPHGDTGRSSTLKLGVQTYGNYIQHVKNSFTGFKIKQRVHPCKHEFLQHLREGTPSNWVEVFVRYIVSVDCMPDVPTVRRCYSLALGSASQSGTYGTAFISVSETLQDQTLCLQPRCWRQKQTQGC